MDKWDYRFWSMAKLVATFAKDKGRKVGAVIINEDKRVLSVGFNGMPQGINDEIESRHQRPEKYFWTEHAERNCIYSASRLGVSLINTSMYVTLFPCSGCARAIIQTGIKHIYTKKPNFPDETYGEEWVVSLEMLNEANVEINFLKDEDTKQ